MWLNAVVKHSAVVSMSLEHLKCHSLFIFGCWPVKNVQSLKIKIIFTTLQGSNRNWEILSIKVLGAHKMEGVFFLPLT